MNRNLILCSVFHNSQYLDLLDLFVKSLVLKGNVSDETDLLVFTSDNLKEEVKNILNNNNQKGDIHVLPFKSLFEASCARLYIFNYPKINDYKKILYSDIDILVCGDVNKLFNIPIQNKLYAKTESIINCAYHGSQFFDFSKINPNTPAFNAGVLLFNNSEEIKNLFNLILNHINEFFKKGNPSPICLEQPFLNYHTIISNLRGEYVFDKEIVIYPTELNPDIVLYHMQGGPGHYPSKIAKMKLLYDKLRAQN